MHKVQHPLIVCLLEHIKRLGYSLPQLAFCNAPRVQLHLVENAIEAQVVIWIALNRIRPKNTSSSLLWRLPSRLHKGSMTALSTLRQSLWAIKCRSANSNKKTVHQKKFCGLAVALTQKQLPKKLYKQ